MIDNKKGVIRAIWNGPFYIGPLTSPVSVGDVLLKALETLWRGVVLIFVMIFIITCSIIAWTQIIEPLLFPPLKTQITATALYAYPKFQLFIIIRCDPLSLLPSGFSSTNMRKL